ncbi:MAG TPA: hypothetical protein VHP83_21815, partial [Aggregatilineaceae bacterium]|nr:hypothetical protein [Aggregatilineaceae bacterium]
MAKLNYLLDGVWLLALALYVLVGVDQVPFHGDESMLVSMSQDYAYLVQQHTAGPIQYQSNHPDTAQQELRILNGTTGKMAMGLAWDLAGYELDDLNDPWWWGFSDPSGDWNEWTWNIYSGHKPGDGVLHAARISSAVLGISGIWA